MNHKDKKKINLELLDYKLNTLLKSFEDLKNDLEEKYVSKEGFTAYENRIKKIEAITYTMTGTILLAFLGALISLVIS
jgi:hypothetical protein